MRNIKIIPQVGEKRIKRWFAWFPVTTENYHVSETRWLEWVTVEQNYEGISRNYGIVYYWANSSFVEEE